MERTIRVLFAPGKTLELPAGLVASVVNDPTADVATVRVMVAEVPSALMLTFDGEITGGTKAGKKEKVALVRFNPVT